MLFLLLLLGQVMRTRSLRPSRVPQILGGNTCITVRTGPVTTAQTSFFSNLDVEIHLFLLEFQLRGVQVCQVFSYSILIFFVCCNVSMFISESVHLNHLFIYLLKEPAPKFTDCELFSFFSILLTSALIFLIVISGCLLDLNLFFLIFPNA